MGGGKFEDLDRTGLQINGRGTSSWFLSTKRSFNLKFENKEVVCGMAKSKKWALIDNYQDRSLLRNRYVSYLNHSVFTNLGWNPSYVPCDFFLNGEYKGNYIIAERNKIESERLQIKDISKVSNIRDGGFLCEIDERFDEPYHFRTSHGINAYSGEYGIAICLKDPDEVSEEVFEYVRFVIQEAKNAIYSEDFKDPVNGYARYFDLNSLIDWYLIHEFVSMYDASCFYTSAFFYYDPSDQKIHMGPCWDYDTALRRDVPGLELREINSWYNRLFEDEALNERVKERWNAKKEELKRSVDIIEQYADEIRVSAEYNFMRWEILGTHYEGLPKWEGLKTYEDQVVFLKDWVTNRIDTMDELINKN